MVSRGSSPMPLSMAAWKASTTACTSSPPSVTPRATSCRRTVSAAMRPPASRSAICPITERTTAGPMVRVGSAYTSASAAGPRPTAASLNPSGMNRATPARWASTSARAAAGSSAKDTSISVPSCSPRTSTMRAPALRPCTPPSWLTTSTRVVATSPDSDVPSPPKAKNISPERPSGTRNIMPNRNALRSERVRSLRVRSSSVMAPP